LLMAVKPFFSCVKSNQQWKTQGQYCWVYRLILVYVGLVTEESETVNIVSACQKRHGTPGNQTEKVCFHTMCCVENLQRTLSNIVEQFLTYLFYELYPFPLVWQSWFTVFLLGTGCYCDWVCQCFHGGGCYIILLRICCSKIVKHEELGIMYNCHHPK
jgi:hypothetical protein